MAIGLPSGRRDQPLNSAYGAEAGQTYEWQILTRDGDLRTSGQFQTAKKRTGTGRT